MAQQAVREVPPHLVTRLTEHKTLDKLARGNLVHNRFKKLRAIVKLSQVCEDAGFTVTVAQGQFCVTRSAMELKGHDAISPCREYTHSRDDDKSYPKGITGNGARVDVLVTEQCNRYGIEMRIESLVQDGSQSWVVISRGVERQVTELSLDCFESVR